MIEKEIKILLSKEQYEKIELVVLVLPRAGILFLQDVDP